MKTHKIHSEVKHFEKEIPIFLKNLSKQKIFLSKNNSYLQKDKQDFLVFWKGYSHFFSRFQKVIKRSNYRRFLVFVDYDKFILQRYLVISYFNLLADILEIFGEHDEFIRTYLDEDSKISYGVVAKFLYKRHYIGLLNTPDSLVTVQSLLTGNEFQKYIQIEKSVILNNRRIITDYKNIFFYLKRRVLKLLFVFSKYSGKVIAATKFSSRKHGLISNKNLKEYLKISKPGDIFLSRGNWNASNITIPGFWKHMSLYIGTGDFLKKNFGKQYSFLKKLYNSQHYIIEATGEGVQIVEIEKFTGHNDYLAISRTKFSTEKISSSIDKALSYYGRGYDHIFNFYSDKAVVCSELVLKSFSPINSKDDGIELHLEKIGVSLTYPPNNFVTEVFKQSGQLKFVMFLDSIEKKGENFISTKKEFKKSNRRSRFSFMLK